MSGQRCNGKGGRGECQGRGVMEREGEKGK